MSCRAPWACAQHAGTPMATGRPPPPRRCRSPLGSAPLGSEAKARRRMLVLSAAAADGQEGGNGATPSGGEGAQPEAGAPVPVHVWDAYG